MTCPQCRRNCRKLHSILAPGQPGNYWHIECCGTCKRSIQRERERRQDEREKQYRT